jgi:heat shock protein HtpX
MLRSSGFEKHSFLTGVLLLPAGFVLTMANEDPGGPAQLLGVIGLLLLALSGLSRAARLYRSGVPASLPRSVGRVGVRIRPRRLSTATTTFFSLGLPAGAATALVAIMPWGWIAIGAVLLIGLVALDLTASNRPDPDLDRLYAADAPTAVLERLCMRADIRVPELIVELGPDANAWTTTGRIHVTRPLLELLDGSEIEAVLAHELAHLAHRDAAAMDVCAAPSRVLLGFANGAVSAFKAWMRNLTEVPFPGAALWLSFWAALSVPPAFVLGWVARLSVLRMSRTREFAADAAAAALTGRPSALASALLKLDEDSARIPHVDLRRIEGHAMLCILGEDRSRLGRVFCTHPRTAARVERLRALEERVQAGGRAVQLDG